MERRKTEANYGIAKNLEGPEIVNFIFSFAYKNAESGSKLGLVGLVETQLFCTSYCV